MRFYNEETKKFLNVSMLDERTENDYSQDLIDVTDWKYDEEKEAYLYDEKHPEFALIEWLNNIAEYGEAEGYEYANIEVLYECA